MLILLETTSNMSVKLCICEDLCIRKKLCLQCAHCILLLALRWMQQPREQLHGFVFFLGFGKTSREAYRFWVLIHTYYTFLFSLFFCFREWFCCWRDCTPILFWRQKKPISDKNPFLSMYTQVSTWLNILYM